MKLGKIVLKFKFRYLLMYFFQLLGKLVKTYDSLYLYVTRYNTGILVCTVNRYIGHNNTVSDLYRLPPN